MVASGGPGDEDKACRTPSHIECKSLSHWTKRQSKKSGAGAAAESSCAVRATISNRNIPSTRNHFI